MFQLPSNLNGEGLMTLAKFDIKIALIHNSPCLPHGMVLTVVSQVIEDQQSEIELSYGVSKNFYF